MPKSLRLLEVDQLSNALIMEALVNRPNLKVRCREQLFSVVDYGLRHLPDTEDVNRALVQSLISQMMGEVEQATVSQTLLLQELTLGFKINLAAMQRLLRALHEYNTPEAWFICGLLKEGRKNFLLEMKSTDRFSYELFISCCLFVEGYELPEIIDTIASIFTCNSTCLIIFLCSRLDLIESRESFCSTILESSRFKNDVYGHNIIRAIANSMPENQDHHDKKIRVLNLLNRIRNELELVHTND